MEKVNSLKFSFINQPSVYLNRLSLVCFLSAVTILAFFPTFFNSFQLAWDDTWQVLENPLVHDYSLKAIFFHFTHFWQGQYSPVNSLFYLMINMVFGMSATAFHIACLLIHLVNSWLVFSISISVISKFLPTIGNSRTQGYAILAALLFAAHPLQVESVAWISASKIILYGLFTLSAIWSYFRYIQNKKTIWLIVTASAYIFGFASKEQAIILPLNLLLIDFTWGRFTGMNWRQLLSSRVILEKILFFLLALAFLYFTWVNSPGGIQEEAGYPLHQRILFGFYSLVEYVFRFLAPAKLYFFHPFPMLPGEVLPLYYLGYLPLAGIIGYFVWDQYRNGNPIVLIGFLFFLVNLVLVLHIIPLPRPVITADRYMYLSIIGLAWVLLGLADSWFTTKTAKNHTPILLGGMIWLIFLGVQTYLRTAEWKDSETTKSNVNELIEKKSKAEETENLFNLIEHE